MIMYMYRKQIIAVTNRHLCAGALTEQIERVCRFRPGAVILREKDMSEQEYLPLAGEIMEICRSYDIPCILHTFINAARALNNNSIHLPLTLLREQRGTLEDFVTVGVSVHSVEDAREAELLGASYLTAGHIYTTDCKKGVPPRGPAFLSEVCRAVSIPVYAIGGIGLKEQQMEEVLSCGARGGCVMSAMMRGL